MDDRTCAGPGCMNPPRARHPNGRGTDPLYCSKRCQDRAAYSRYKDKRNAALRATSAAIRGTTPCVICGSVFAPKTVRSRACSRKCASKLYRENVTKVCTHDDCDRPTTAKGLCRKHYAAKFAKQRGWKKNGKPETRRAALRRKTQRRRALILDPLAEDIDRDKIGARDGWKCGLCGRRVNNTLLWPHLRSASLDHIVPLSVGGTHSRDNVQIAHFECNMAKGNRGGGEQLLLIG